MWTRNCSVVPRRCGDKVMWSLGDACVWVVFGGGQGGLMYQSHTDNIKGPLCSYLWGSSCEPPHDSAFMLDHSHMPHWSPMLPSAPLLSSQAAEDKVTATRSTYKWGFDLRHILMPVGFWASHTLCLFNPLTHIPILISMFVIFTF